MPGVLSGIRVIDFGQYLAGPLVAQLLADQGADVIRVDPPGGPMWRADANAILQRGKRSIVLDLKTAGDQDLARRLVQSADVVVENFRPSVMDRLGLAAREMLQAHPGLIFCSIPGFASDDPRARLPGREGLAAAVAGLYPPLEFEPDGPPVYNTLPLASVMAAMIAANSILAALIARERFSGRGQRIEVSLFDAAYELVRFYGDRLPVAHQPGGRFMLGGASTVALTAHYRCEDGRFVHLSWLEGRQLEEFARRVGVYDAWAAAGLLEADLPTLRTDRVRSDRIRQALAEVFATRTAAEWETWANPHCDLAACQTTEEWLLFDEQARLTEAVISLTDPELGLTHQMGYPISLSKTPARARGPRHALDADRQAILSELDRLPRPTPPAANGRGPVAAALQGIKAVDATQLLAGPTACRILAEYGAEVVQITNPHGRASRAYHHQVDAGKRTMLLDLKRLGALDVFWKLVEQADVLSTNFSSSVAERLGVDEATARRHRPDIIYSRISAHGLIGPRSEYRGHEQVGQSVTGMQVRYGKDALHPIMQPFAVNDVGTGHLCAFGILLALFHRLRTGEGQHVGASLAHTAALYQTPYMLAYKDKVWDEAGGLQCRGKSPLERAYRASDRWFFLAAPSRDALASVEGLAGIESLAGADLEGALSERLARAPLATWLERLPRAGVGAHVSSLPEEAMQDAWALEHGVVREVDFPHAGPGLVVGPAPRLGLTPMRAGYPPPPIGWDGEEILREVGLGGRLDDLVQSGALVLPCARQVPV